MSAFAIREQTERDVVPQCNGVKEGEQCRVALCAVTGCLRSIVKYCSRPTYNRSLPIRSHANSESIIPYLIADLKYRTYSDFELIQNPKRAIALRVAMIVDTSLRNPLSNAQDT
jgi:hypothetical protein